MTTVNTTYSSREGATQNFTFPVEKPLKKSPESFYLCVDSNHLGNVMAVVSDKKMPVDDRYWDYNTNQWVYSPDGTIDYFAADVISTVDYYPGGMLLPGRNSSPDEYRYGHNGQESDAEISGSWGSHYTAQFWMYDSRIIRRWNLDPKPNSSISQYNCFAGNPILYSDPFGDTTFVDKKGYVLDAQRKNGALIDNFVYMCNADGTQKSLGEFTGDLDADEWMTNLLATNAKEADEDLWNPKGDFEDFVRANGKWDYKNLNQGNKLLGTGGRKEHVLGIAFSLGTDTRFKFNKQIYRSEDLNNLHFGVVGKAMGTVPEWVLHYGAGLAEQGKWDDAVRTWMDDDPFNDFPVKDYNFDRWNWDKWGGDNPVDYEMIERGFDYYDKNRKSLDGDYW